MQYTYLLSISKIHQLHKQYILLEMYMLCIQQGKLYNYQYHQLLHNQEMFLLDKLQEEHKFLWQLRNNQLQQMLQYKQYILKLQQQQYLHNFYSWQVLQFNMQHINCQHHQ